jgi:transcriptional regulator with XRE-family HTH domain
VVELRQQRNLSQELLAHASGLSVKTVSRIENGHHDGRFDTFDRLAQALEMTAQELLDPARGTPEPASVERLEMQLAAMQAQLDEILTALGRAMSQDEGARPDPGRAAGQRVPSPRSASRRRSA